MNACPSAKGTNLVITARDESRFASLLQLADRLEVEAVAAEAAGYASIAEARREEAAEARRIVTATRALYA